MLGHGAISEFAISEVPSGEEPPLGQRPVLADFARSAPRAAFSAYFILLAPQLLAPTAEDQEAQHRQEVTARAPAAARATVDAYQAGLPHFVVQSEPQTGTTALIPDRAPGCLRAGRDAYLTASQFVVQSEPQPGVGLAVTARAPPALRSTADAYQTGLPRFAVQSEPQAGAGLVVPAAAPGSRRASADAYQAASRAVVADEPEPVNGLILPQAALGARRAAQDAYQTASRLVVQGEPQPGIGLSLPATAPGWRRTAPDAYQAASRFVVQSEPQAAAVQSVTVAAPGWRRAAASIYQVALSPQPADVVTAQPPVAQLAVAVVSPVRAAGDAYRVAATFVIQSEPEPVNGLMLPEITRAASRAGNAAYLVGCRLVSPDEPEPVNGLVLPAAAPGYRRAEPGYAIYNRFIVQSEPQAACVQLVPAAAPGVARTAAAAYAVALAPQAVLEDAEAQRRLSWPDIARASAKARQTAYTIQLAGGILVPDFVPALGEESGQAGLGTPGSPSGRLDGGSTAGAGGLDSPATNTAGQPPGSGSGLGGISQSGPAGSRITPA